MKYFLFSSILICVPFLFSDTIVLNYADMYRYLETVEKMANGEFQLFATKTRSNLFPFILFSWMSVLGFSMESLKLFYCFLIVILSIETWILGRLLFDDQTGFLTSILVVTSFTFSHFLYFPHIDLLLLTFIILFLIIIIIAIRSNTYRNLLLLLSGIIIGIGYLVKESSIYLILFLPVYYLISRSKLSVLVKSWFIQLTPFVFSGGIIIFLTRDAFYSRYIGGATKLLQHLAGGQQTKLMRDPVNGWAVSGTDHYHPIAKFILFLLFPIYWQWESTLFPVNKPYLCIEQILILSSSIAFFIFPLNNRHSKYFIATVLLLYFPKLLYVSIGGAKMRQVLPIFYICYFPFGYILSIFFTKIITFSKFKNRLPVLICLIFTVIYLARLFVFQTNINYTFDNAKPYYNRTIPEFLKK